MRILLVSSSSGSRGGGEIFLLYLAEGLKDSGHTVGLWLAAHPRMDELARLFAPFGPVLRAPYRNTYDHWHRGLLTSASTRTARQFVSSWMEWRPDVMHFNKQNLEDGLDLLAAANALPVPHLCTVHITQSARFLRARFAGWRDAKARRALRAYRGPLVAVASARAAELSEFVSSNASVRAINNGVPVIDAAPTDRVALRAREGLRPDSLAIVAVGRLEAQKCPLRFLDRAARIREAIPHAEFRWIGSGRLTPEWDAGVAARNLGGAVRRIDWREDVRGALPAYDVFLHSAAYEGLPLAVLEAMAAGLPCIVEQNVLTQLPASLQACAFAATDDTNWKALLENRAQLDDRAQRGREIVRAEFSTAAMGRAYAAIYQELCASR